MSPFKISPNGKAQKTGNNFHAMRYLLAVLVLYSHSYGLLKFPEPGLFQFPFGSLAVKCFFALSGYLITLSCLRSANLGHYVLNRTLRILPALLVALILSRIVGKYFNYFIENPVPYIVNGPVWTLSWEVLCYGLCGILWWLGLLSKKTIGPIVVISWLLFLVTPQDGEAIVWVVPLFLLFFTGSFIALNEDRLNFRISGPILLIILIGIAFDTKYTGINWFFNKIPFLYGPGFPSSKYYLIAFLFCTPFALIWLALYIKPVFNLRNDYSYGIYIYGWPVQQMIISIFDPIPLFLFAGSLIITHLIAMFSWHIIEKQALRFKH